MIRTSLALATILFLHARTNAQSQICGPDEYAGTQISFGQAGQLEGGDLDGDGHLDVVASSHGAVQVFLGDGRGRFGPPVTYAAGPSPTVRAIGDLNADMLPDVVVTSNAPFNDSVSVLYGIGAGALGSLTTIGLVHGNSPEHARIADVTGDGIADIVVALFNAGSVAVLAGDGAGGFLAPVTWSSACCPRRVRIADINGDSCVDILTVSSGFSTTINVLLGNGQGGFAAPLSHFAGPVFALDFELMDLDGDGALDAIVSIGGSGDLATLLGDGAGGFGPPKLYGISSTPDQLRLVDVDLDGMREIAVRALNEGRIEFWKSDPLGNIAKIGQFSCGGAPISFFAGNLNRDLIPDLVVSLDRLNTISIAVAREPLSYGPPKLASGSSPSQVVHADFNGDGRPDLACVNRGDGTCHVYENDGAGGFGSALVLNVGASPGDVVATDLNADGHQDLAAASTSSSRVDLFLGDGQGGFSPAGFIAVSSSPEALSVGDLNGDSLPDIVTANSASNDVSVVLTDGQGGYLARVDYPDGSHPLDVALVDLDGVGGLDLVVTTSGQSTFSTRRNDGAGGFGILRNHALGDSAVKVTHGDWNSDGRADLAFSFGFASKRIGLVMGDGSGLFTAPAFFGALASGSDIMTVDFDLDGIDDLAHVSASSGGFQLYRGDGQGGFGRPIFLNSGSSQSAVAAVDLNADLAPDFVVANGNEDTLSLVLSNAWQPVTYCTAKLNSCGSLPSISSSGLSSASSSSGFTISVSNTKAGKFGLLVYSDAGPAALPFAEGTLCVNPTLMRSTPAVGDAAGTPPACDGLLSVDMNAFAAGALGGNPLPSAAVPGTQIHCQFWGRDTFSKTLLSNGLRYVVCP